LLGYWGYAYLRVCFLVLAAPGRPIVLKYEAPAGVVSLRADSYSFSLHNGRLTAYRPRAIDPDGKVIAAARYLTLTQLDWRLLNKQRIELSLDHLTGRVLRLANGSFALDRLIPPRAAKPSQIPFHISVKTANVVLVDQAGNGWSQEAYSPAVEVSGVGSDWIAHGQVSLPGMGAATGRAQYVLGEGLYIEGVTRKLEATKALTHFLRTDLERKHAGLKDLDLEGVTLTGAFQLNLSKSRRSAFSAQSSFTAKSVLYGKYTATNIAFDGLLTSEGMIGTVSGISGGSSASFSGSASWTPGEAASGYVRASVASLRSLPPFARKLIPNDLSFSNGSYSGYLAFQKGQVLNLLGQVRAGRLSYKKYVAQNVQVSLSGNSGRVRADWLSGSIDGTNPQVSADIDVRKQTFTAWTRLHVVDLKKLSQFVDLHGISGSGDIEAFLSGPLRNPSASFEATGVASYSDGHRLKTGPEDIDLAGSYNHGFVLIDRGLIEGAAGTVAVSGQVRPQGNGLSMHVDARDLAPGTVLPGFDGFVDGSANLGGTLAEPTYSGHLEGTDLRYKGHQIIAAGIDFSGNRHEVTATKINGVSGTMALLGQLTCALPSKALKGQLQLTGVQATDYLGPQFAGIINARHIEVSGTLTKPAFVAAIDSKELVADEIVLSSLTAAVQGNLDQINLDNGEASLAGGTVSAKGSYSFAKKSGNVSASTSNLDLSRLAPALGEHVAITGTTEVSEIDATIHGSKVDGVAKGRIDKLTVNGAPAGDGNWSADLNGNLLSAQLSVGQVLPKLRVFEADATYDLKSKSITGSLDARDARIQDLLGAASRYLPDSLTADPQQLGSIEGDLTFNVALSGQFQDVNVLFETLRAENLTYKTEPLGSLAADGTTRNADNWTVPGLSLVGPQGNLNVNGTVAEHGDIAVSAIGNGLKLSSLSPFAESLTSSKGLADFTLQASGKTESPSITGSATLNDILEAPAALQAKERESLSVQIPQISMDNSKVQVGGRFDYAGFSGAFSGTAPFTYKRGLGTGDAHAAFTVDQKSLLDLPLIAEYLDKDRTTGGTIAGSVTATGPLDSLTYAGGITLSAKSAGVVFPEPSAYVKRIDDTLENLSASLQFGANRTVELKATTGLSRGGVLAANASTPFLDLGSLLRGNFDAAIQQFLNSPISGSVTADNVKFRQAAPGGYVAATLAGTTPVGGTVRQPSIGLRQKPGAFTINDLDTSMPTLVASSGAEQAPYIDPSFFLNASLGNEARVRSATADLRVTGDGQLRGKLSDPRATASLVVEKGTIVLPGGTVRLDPGGTVDFAYRHSFGEEPVASLNVDLIGRTGLTAVGLGRVTAQHYNVTLEMNGDLLKTSDLVKQATSDPPDLSQAEILSLLGQGDLFYSASNSLPGANDAQTRITQALAGFAVPAVLSPYTSQLAQQLGLDYLSLEYNAFDQTTLNVARALGADLSLQYRGQIGNPIAGIRPIQDFELIFTPRRLPGQLRHLSFALGSDQDVPWKVSLQYGIRFGKSTNPQRGKKTVLFAPQRNASPSGPSKLPVVPGG
jgi:hypothetical protein